MADTSQMADIRGIDITKLAIQYAEEASIFKRFCAIAPTTAREIRWYRKTAGIISSPTTTGITTSRIANVAYGAQPVVAEQSWTRYTSYNRKYMVESPMIPQEDIDDCDIDILAQNLRDLALMVEYQVDARIWDVMTESRLAVSINSGGTTAAWDTASYTGVNIIKDIMVGIENIRINSGFDPLKYGGVLLLSPKDHRNMLTWIIDGKGSSVPSFAAAKLQEGTVMNILGLDVAVSNNVTADYACIMIPKLSITWKQFVPISTAVITEEGIGKKIRIWEEGEAVLVRPKCVHLIVNTQA